MKNIILVFSILLLALVGEGAVAIEATFPIQCPESISVTEQASDIESGWEPIIDKGRAGYFLENVGFYSGNPVDLASLAPDVSKRIEGGRRSSWAFSDDHADGYWVVCSYQNTRLIIAKKLPPEIKRCEVTEKLLSSGRVVGIKDVACKTQ